MKTTQNYDDQWCSAVKRLYDAIAAFDQTKIDKRDAQSALTDAEHQENIAWKELIAAKEAFDEVNELPEV